MAKESAKENNLKRRRMVADKAEKRKSFCAPKGEWGAKRGAGAAPGLKGQGGAKVFDTMSKTFALLPSKGRRELSKEALPRLQDPGPGAGLGP